MTYANEEVIRVHVENLPNPVRRDRNGTFRTVYLTANQPVQLLGHAPQRRRAVLTIVGQSSDVVYLCDDLANAQKNEGAICMGLQVIELTTAEDVWAVSATAPAIGIVCEYAAPGA